ncbi:hypothetical protein FOA52_001930 [Chlamydomonas sp. UWO 241]|nr:hypothetical protein FOA52_001930 [Chlamydomonas sp. UWO 241]
MKSCPACGVEQGKSSVGSSAPWDNQHSLRDGARRSAPRPSAGRHGQDTIVTDPFFTEMPKFFNLTFKELLAAKHPTAWLEFETGEITEAECNAKFFLDGREFNGDALRAMMIASYRYLDGMEELLVRLKAAGYEIHALSNYPTWYECIEEKLHLSQHLEWTFVSCVGPMKGHRKPSRAAYEAVISQLQLPPSQLIFVDDRQVNIDGAKAVGLDALLFKNAATLEAQLLERGLVF